MNASQPTPRDAPANRGDERRRSPRADDADLELQAEDGFFGHDVRAQVLDPTPVRVAGLYFLPRRFRAVVDDLELPCLVTLTVAVGDDGVAGCEEVTLRARPGADVRAPMLRDIPLKRLTRLAASAVRESTPRHASGFDEHRDLVARFDHPIPPRRGRQHGEEHYREIARVYTAAVDAGEPPIERIMETFYLAKSTAYRHVARAKPYLSRREPT